MSKINESVHERRLVQVRVVETSVALTYYISFANSS